MLFSHRLPTNGLIEGLLHFTAAVLSEVFTPFPILPFRALLRALRGTCEYPVILFFVSIIADNPRQCNRFFAHLT